MKSMQRELCDRGTKEVLARINFMGHMLVVMVTIVIMVDDHCWMPSEYTFKSKEWEKKSTRNKWVYRSKGRANTTCA